ncbi:MAG TPA: M2 family metallopeptidase, partial [Longimicrobiales bacterium]
MRPLTYATTLTVLLALAAAAPTLAQQPATAAEAQAFMERAEKQLGDLSISVNRAGWVADNFITDDTQELSAEAQDQFAQLFQKLALEARRFDALQLDPALRRKFNLLKLGLAAPPPPSPVEASELTRVQVSMQADYGKGTFCRPDASAPGGKLCRQLPDLEKVLRESRDPAVLLDAWAGWHSVGAPMRERYTRFAELSNKGARDLGFKDVGAMWRSGYDMPPAEFEKELDRIWGQVSPLYLQLRAYVRTRLGEKYGTQLVPRDGLIPAHLLGNMWAQGWSNIYDIVAPAAWQGGASAGVDVTSLLARKNVDALGMVHYGENFYTSLGLRKLPESFWTRSLFTKPRDRDVVCHASAWDIDNKDDVRIKACFEPNAEDFVTVHHEMGHDYYFLAYEKQPYLFQNGANDGFHEAIGDAIALSITPAYLKQVGLLDSIPPVSGDTALLLRQALDKVAFLPFGLLIDQWRWKVFSGEVTPANYNAAWWDLKQKYQGVVRPLPVSEKDFDPGAKYHVPANTPYTRYFLAGVLEFQFYRAMCRAAGHQGPLYRCSYFGSKAAGQKLETMLERGASQPWQQTLAEMTGEKDIDASAIVEYFQPLMVWLQRQNQGHQVGWAGQS